VGMTAPSTRGSFVRMTRARSCVDPAVRPTSSIFDARGIALLIAFVACSSGKPKQVEDARRKSQDTSMPTDGTPSIDAASATTPTPKTPTTGDVQIRVEWPTMPLAARVSPGASACGTPLVAQVAPTTTWGIPDVVVFVDGAPPTPNVSASSAYDARVAIDRCAVTPRIAIGSKLSIASVADRPLEASLAKRFATNAPKIGLEAPVVPVALPIAGHEVTTALDDNAIYRIAPAGKDVGDGYVVSAIAFITDATGVALIKDVPPGKHAVHVWLAPRGGQPARHAKGEVTVEIGDLAELTLTLE
jgi:hypothetical protein